MNNNIGIRHEDKYLLERRSPLTPKHIERLIKSKNLVFVVQTSDKRIYSDKEYRVAGARVENNLNDCNIIFGVKEIPIECFEPNKTYIFFSHVIKGQAHNMPMLRRMMELKCNLIDYERIVDELDRRMIFFGRYAGLAGMIDSLWAAGLRLKEAGIITPFLQIKKANQYNSLAEAQEVISHVGQLIAENGLPEEITPFTIGVTGYGNVSQGAQEILNLLPTKEISPQELLLLKQRNKLPNNLIYKVVFKQADMFEALDGSNFDLQEFYTNPHEFQSVFAKYIPYIDILINCIYWNEKFPRIVTKEYLRNEFLPNQSKLILIGDLSCDIHGSIECTEIATEIDDPIYVYHPDTDSYTMGHEGNGILILAVDILPSELPRDASNGFSDILYHFVEDIADCDFRNPFETLHLPWSIKNALILHQGSLTYQYKYIEEYLHHSQSI